MASGGRRNRSGPQPDPGSGRSERREFALEALPASGYDGPVPVFPLPSPSDRELDVWTQAWSSPQACAWSQASESWRVRTVAMWVRLSVRAEDPEAGASLIAQVHRFADQIGMTTAGLAEMGWRIVPDEPADDASSGEAPEPTQRRLRAVPGGA